VGGANGDLFHQGAAKESRDPDVIAATMATPEVVLKRPVGSDGTFGEHADCRRASCITASRHATSSASSRSPTMSRSGEPGSRTGC
jgi:hypothetical protein